MVTTKVKHKAVKDATISIGFNNFISLMMASIWNISQASYQSKSQASLYKNEAI